MKQFIPISVFQKLYGSQSDLLTPEGLSSFLEKIKGEVNYVGRNQTGAWMGHQVNLENMGFMGTILNELDKSLDTKTPGIIVGPESSSRSISRFVPPK